MKILLHTAFSPSVGGIETVARLLVHEWIRAGVSVCISTSVPAGSLASRAPAPVFYQPGPANFFRLVRQSDVLVHFNVSLRAYWPLLLVRRGFVIGHQGLYEINRARERDWRERLKLKVARKASANIAASHAIEQGIGIPCTVIPNPYDDGVFKNNTGGARDEDLIFVGRLVSDKGADGLLQALSLLKRRGIRPRLTIVGDGPERDVLERLAQELELKAQIDFVGVKAPADIAGLLTRHKILVVPSLWNEPFGIVALEGIACGCAVLGSNGGGLPEAMGPCGLTFERGNAGDLADKIEMLLGDLELRSTLQTNADWHLRKHQPAAVAARYLDVIERAISKYG